MKHTRGIGNHLSIKVLNIILYITIPEILKNRVTIIVIFLIISIEERFKKNSCMFFI